MTERHSSIDQLHVFVGPKLKAGFIPLSDNSMYLFTTMSYPPHTRIDESKTHIILKEALKDFTAPIVVEVRQRMGSPEKVVWRPFENTLVPPPWYRGRVILIGDAAHTMTPHLTAGGGMAIEDAVILAETLAQAGSVPDALRSFMNRRFERVRAACDISLEICKLEQAPHPVSRCNNPAHRHRRIHPPLIPTQSWVTLLIAFPSWALNCFAAIPWSLCCIQTHGRRFLLARPPFYLAF